MVLWWYIQIPHTQICDSQGAEEIVLQLGYIKAVSKEATSTWYQFMGFVSSHTKEGNYLVGFHPSSFVIFWTDLKYSNTIEVCTLTSHHHILSNMEDWLLQLLQIFQYLHHNIEFQLLITNDVVGDDVTLQYWSRLAYSSMWFDTSTLTQDCNDIVFFIKTYYPIPMFQYGNLFTWAKYVYIILHPVLTCTVLSGLDKTYCKTVTTFLETDKRGIMNFQMQLHLQAEINLYLSSIFSKDMSRSQRPSYFDQFLATWTKPVSEMFSFLAKKANKATVLPFWYLRTYSIKGSLSIDFLNRC